MALTQIMVIWTPWRSPWDHLKKEQGAKRDEKGAAKIGQKERVPKNGRENGVKCQREQGA